MFMSQVTFFIPTTCMIIHVWIWVMSWMKYGHYIINNWFICIWYISQIQYKNYFRCIILFWNCQKWPEQLLYQKIIMSQFDISHVCRCRLQAIFVLYVGGNMFFFLRAFNNWHRVWLFYVSYIFDISHFVSWTQVHLLDFGSYLYY